MKMQLISLTLENFKGHERLSVQFNGKSANIYGNNGTGKTSIYDGLTWLLFGKDSHGRKDFDIKPLTAEGTVRDHAAISSVEAVFCVDGTEWKLKRTYYEVWSTKRGSAEETFDGHSSDYFVDDVPVKKGEFARRVNERIDEDVFRLLTSITYFAAELPWQQRRAALFRVAAVMSDAEIMADAPQFAPLNVALQGLSLDDYRKKLAAQRKGLNQTRTYIPARLDECKKTVEDLSGIDFAALERRKAEVQSQREQLQKELDQAEHDSGRTDLQNRLVAARNELARLENENAAYRLRQQAENGRNKAASFQRTLEDIRAREARRQRELDYLRKRQQELDSSIVAYRSKWNAISAEQFQGGVCPTCGQTLPPARLEASKVAFEQDKQHRKNDTVAAANHVKATLSGIQGDIANLEQEAASDLEQEDILAKQLQAMKNVPEQAILDMGGFAVQKAELESRIAALQQEQSYLEAGSTDRRKTLQEQLNKVDQELAQLSGELAKRTALNYASRRMEELREQAASAANELNQVDEMLFLCDEFVRYKVKFVEESINSKFTLVKFRLFREQINGGLEDCCEVMVNGVPYSTNVNTGAKFNAGIDIINTLSRHYGVYVPLFVDNAESVTQLEQANTQVIRLVVSETDETLRIEV